MAILTFISGVAYSKHIVHIYSYHGSDDLRNHLEVFRFFENHSTSICCWSYVGLCFYKVFYCSNLMGYLLIQIDAHVGNVSDLAFSHPNKQLCIITCGEDKTIKVSFD